jgi:hypothetical protein
MVAVQNVAPERRADRSFGRAIDRRRVSSTVGSVRAPLLE